MKKVTMNYIASLGSFLDEENIFFSTDKSGKLDTITFKVNDDETLFRLAMKFQRFVTKVENED